MNEPKDIQALVSEVQNPIPRLLDVKFKFLKDAWGQTYVDTGIIHLNRQLLDKIIATWVHEKIHILYPDIAEAMVKTLEAQVIKKLSLAQKVKLFKEIAYLLK